MNHQTNITRIKAVYRALDELANDVVFVGGAVISLYADFNTGEIRPTDDIDVVIEIWSHKEFAEIEERLRKKGFVNDIDSKVICRYNLQGIIVDIMPTREDVLGFSNPWYADGFKNSIPHSLSNDEVIRIFSSPYFVASKVAAFNSRGNNDGRTSTDFEDIIFILENRGNIWTEMENADEEVRQFLKYQFRKLLSDEHFEEWVDSHAAYGSPPATYYILERLENFART